MTISTFCTWTTSWLGSTCFLCMQRFPVNESCSHLKRKWFRFIKNNFLLQYIISFSVFITYKHTENFASFYMNQFKYLYIILYSKTLLRKLKIWAKAALNFHSQSPQKITWPCLTARWPDTQPPVSQHTSHLLVLLPMIIFLNIKF